MEKGVQKVASDSLEKAVVEKMPLNDILTQVQATASGEHNLLLYSDNRSFCKIYSEYCKKRLQENDIVILLSYFETEEHVKQVLSDAGVDVDQHTSDGSLVIGDTAKTIYGTETNLLQSLLNLERLAKRTGKSCVSVIVSMGAFFLHDRVDEMLEYEGLLDLSHIRNWKVLCCYTTGDFNRLSESQKQELLGRHNRKMFTI